VQLDKSRVEKEFTPYSWSPNARNIGQSRVKGYKLWITRAVQIELVTLRVSYYSRPILNTFKIAE